MAARMLCSPHGTPKDATSTSHADKLEKVLKKSTELKRQQEEKGKSQTVVIDYQLEKDIEHIA